VGMGRSVGRGDDLFVEGFSMWGVSIRNESK